MNISWHVSIAVYCSDLHSNRVSYSVVFFRHDILRSCIEEHGCERHPAVVWCNHVLLRERRPEMDQVCLGAVGHDTTGGEVDSNGDWSSHVDRRCNRTEFVGYAFVSLHDGRRSSTQISLWPRSNNNNLKIHYNNTCKKKLFFHSHLGPLNCRPFWSIMNIGKQLEHYYFDFTVLAEIKKKYDKSASKIHHFW